MSPGQCHLQQDRASVLIRFQNLLTESAEIFLILTPE